MIKRSVIVTALFDIGRDKWDNYNQSYNTYLFWMDNILNVDSDFIIYTEQKFLGRIIESRKKIDKDLSSVKINTHTIIIKISGIWSSNDYFGLTYKLLTHN